MKIIKNKQSKIIIGVSIIAILVSIAAAYYLFAGVFIIDNDKSLITSESTPSVLKRDINRNPPTEAEKKETNQQKEQIINRSIGQPPRAMSVTIIRASQETAGGILNVRTLVTGATKGTCKVTLSRTGQPTISKTFPVSFEATSATCAHVDIDRTEFGASGEWDLSVIVEDNTGVSNPATMRITIS